MTTVPRLHVLAALACALLIVIGSAPPWGHAQSTADAERYFKVEWEPDAVPRSSVMRAEARALDTA